MVEVQVIGGPGGAYPHKVGEFRITGKADAPFEVCAKTAWGIVGVADPWPTKIWQVVREWLNQFPDDERIEIEGILYGETEGTG